LELADFNTQNRIATGITVNQMGEVAVKKIPIETSPTGTRINHKGEVIISKKTITTKN